MSAQHTISKERVAFGRKNLDSQTQSLFKILASYFSNMFYNYGYQTGKKLFIDKRGGVKNITEGYKHFCNAFLLSLQKKNFTGDGSYTHMLGTIAEFCGKFTGNPITRGHMIAEIFRCFTPVDMHKDVSNEDMRTFVRDVMLSVSKKMVEKIVDENIVDIIDNHENKENQIQLTEDIINILVAEREIVMAKFITGKKSSTAIDAGHYNLLRAEYEKEVQMRTEIMQQMQALQQQNENLKNESIRLIQICRELEKKNRTYKDEIAKLENTVYELRKQPTPKWQGGMTYRQQDELVHDTTEFDAPESDNVSDNLEDSNNFNEFQSKESPDQSDQEPEIQPTIVKPLEDTPKTKQENMHSTLNPPPQPQQPQPSQTQPTQPQPTQPQQTQPAEQKKKRGRKKKDEQTQPQQTQQQTTEASAPTLPLSTDMGPTDNIFDNF